MAGVQQFPQILHGRGNGRDEVLLALKIASETVCSQHLQRAEQNKQRQACYEMMGRGNLCIVLERMIILVNQFAP